MVILNPINIKINLKNQEMSNDNIKLLTNKVKEEGITNLIVDIKEELEDILIDNFFEKYRKKDEEDEYYNINFSTKKDKHPDLYKIFNYDITIYEDEYEKYIIIYGYVLWPIYQEKKIKRTSESIYNSDMNINDIILTYADRTSLNQYKIIKNKTEKLLEYNVEEETYSIMYTMCENNIDNEFYSNITEEEIENFIDDNMFDYMEEAEEEYFSNKDSMFLHLWNHRYGEDHI